MKTTQNGIDDFVALAKIMSDVIIHRGGTFRIQKKRHGYRRTGNVAFRCTGHEAQGVNRRVKVTFVFYHISSSGTTIQLFRINNTGWITRDEQHSYQPRWC